MVKKRLEYTEYLYRIAVLPYNKNFEKDLHKIRKKYGLNEINNEDAWNWYLEQVGFEGPKTKLPVKSAFGLFRPRFLNPKHREASRSIEYLDDSEVEIERDIANLMFRYQIPMVVFISILHMVLQGEVFNLTSNAAYYPALIEIIDYAPGGHFAVKIGNLCPWTTKKDWDKLWDEEVMPLVKSIREELGFTRLSTKRTALNKCEEEMKRWSEWYQLVEIEGLSIKDALNQWQESHPDLVPLKGINESTVSKAVSEFRKLITPNPSRSEILIG